MKELVRGSTTTIPISAAKQRYCVPVEGYRCRCNYRHTRHFNFVYGMTAHSLIGSGDHLTSSEPSGGLPSNDIKKEKIYICGDTVFAVSDSGVTVACQRVQR